MEACFRELLAEGGLVILHVRVVGAILSEQAGREGVHGGMRAAARDVCRSGGACLVLASCHAAPANHAARLRGCPSHSCQR